MDSNRGCTSTFTLRGDADGNGTIDVVDALLAARCHLHFPNPSPFYPGATDVDGSGSVDMQDAEAIAEEVLGF